MKNDDSEACVLSRATSNSDTELNEFFSFLFFSFRFEHKKSIHLHCTVNILNPALIKSVSLDASGGK